MPKTLSTTMCSRSNDENCNQLINNQCTIIDQHPLLE